MTVETLDSNQARNNWREMLDSVATRHTDVVITRYNKPVVTVVAYEDYIEIRDELARRRAKRMQQLSISESMATTFASEQVLARDWNTAEEDEAWVDL